MPKNSQPLVLNFDEHNHNAPQAANALQAAPIGGPILIGDAANPPAVPMGKIIAGAPIALPVMEGAIIQFAANAPVEIIGKMGVVFLNNAEAGDDDVLMQ